MGANTKIQWADDSVNIWWGCQRHGTGCTNCYAEALASRFHPKWKLWGNAVDSVRLYMPNWESTLRRLNSKAEKEGQPRVVFVNSMSDFFEDFSGPLRVAGKNEETGERELHHTFYGPKRMRDGSVGRGVVMPGQMLRVRNEYRYATVGDLREEAFRVFDECQWLLLMLLTKRPENVRRMLPIKTGRRDAIKDGRANIDAWRRENVWLGTSIACQEDADRNVPELLKCRDLCAKTVLSIEPLIGPVDLDECWPGGMPSPGRGPYVPGVDWVIVGGESGPNARPCDIAWIRSIVRQCKYAGVPCFVKQLGARVLVEEYAPHDWPDGVYFSTQSGLDDDMDNDPSVCDLRDPKGGDPAEWPEDVRVREVP